MLSVFLYKKGEEEMNLFSDQMIAQALAQSTNFGFGLGDLQRIGKQLVGVFNSLTTIVRAIIIGLALLVGTIAAIYFLKKDRSGSEEGKASLVRVATAIFVAVVIAMIFSAFSGWLASTFR